MTAEVSPEALAISLSREREKNNELVQMQEKLRRELNKARFQAGHLRTELQNAQTVISSCKDAEQIKQLTEENQSLKLQLDTVKEALRQSVGGSNIPPGSSSTAGSRSSSVSPTETTPSSFSSSLSAATVTDGRGSPGDPAIPAGSIEANTDSLGSASFSEGVKRAYVEIDRLERLLEERTTELNRWKSKTQEVNRQRNRGHAEAVTSSAHEKDLAGLWEQLAKKEEELTALKERHKKSYFNNESIVQEWSKKCQELQSELTRTTSEYEGAQTRLVQVEKEHFTMTEQLSVVTAMRASSETTSTMVQEKLDSTMDELAATKDKLRAANRGKTEAIRELEEARVKFEEVQSDLARLQVAVEEKESAMDTDRRRLEELESLRVQLSEEKRLRTEETDRLSSELEAAQHGLRSLGEEAKGLRQKLLDSDDELSKAKAVITNVTLEAKVANRRNVNIIKDLKAQLKREAAKYDQAQVDITRLENALKLQAEAMLASESSGLQDPWNSDAPGSPSSAGAEQQQQQQQPASPTSINNAGGHGNDNHNHQLFDWGATLSPLLQGLANHPKTQQVFSFSTTTTVTPRTGAMPAPGGSSSSWPPSASFLDAILPPPANEEEASLCSALAKRLETLLAENEQVRERVAFLEKNIRLLQADVGRKGVLLRHFTGSMRGAEEEAASAESIIQAATSEGMAEVGGGPAVMMERVLQGIYVENQRLRRDLKMLGAMRKARAPSEGDVIDDDCSMGGGNDSSTSFMCSS